MNKTTGTELPQGGTSSSAAGESATLPLGASSPSYSGGGNVCLPSASGNKSRGGSRSASFEDLIQNNFKSPEKVSGGRGSKTPSKLWRKSSLVRRGDADSDSGSASGVSVSSASSKRKGLEAAAENSKFFRKRPRPEDDQGSSSNEELASARKIPTSRRGKGREGGRGRGFASQEAAQRASKLAKEGCHPGATGRKILPPASSGGEPDTAGGSDRERQVRFAEAVATAVRDVALKRTQASKNKAISAASASILAAAEANFSGPPSNEISNLRAEVARLAAATELLQKENEKLRADLAGLREAGPKEAPQGGRKRGPSQNVPVEDQLLNLVRQELAAFQDRFQKRFSTLEGIVLRPPLAPSQKVASYATAVAAKPGSSGQTNRGAAPALANKAPGNPAPAQKRKGGAAAQAAIAPAPAVQQPSSPSNPPAAEAGWQVAGERRKAGKAARAAKNRERKRRRKAQGVAARLRAPKTAAVVVTLQPDAVKRGVTYGDVLSKAKEAVNLGELGIVGGLRLRVTMTGARMLEIPGAASGPAADALAERLRASLNVDDARVSRPTKCIDMRILGLDDSVTEEEVVAAVVRTGGCSAEHVKAGIIRPDHTGMRTVLVSCPVTAAKKISEGRRLLVGWVSAQVKLLEPRPLRCFRCLVGNHAGALCTSEVDRSDLCFRCGQPGHKAGSCNATPHCVVCAAAGKPAGHWAGGKACVPPAKARGKRMPFATTIPAVATAIAAVASTAAAATTSAAEEPSQGAQEEAVMEC